MKKILYFLSFVAAVFASFYFLWESIFSAGDSGYVLMGIGNLSLTTSMAFFVLVMVGLFIPLYVFFRLLGWIYRFPRKVKSKSKGIKLNRSQDALVSGLIDVAEGNWERAEKTLIKHAATSSAPLLHYLTAARAAQARGVVKNRDEYLALATKKSPGSKLAINLTAAELNLAQKQFEPALEILKSLYAHNPDAPSVLKLMQQVYIQLGDWVAIKQIIPALQKNKVLNKAELEVLEINACEKLLASIADKNNTEAVLNLWESIPENIQQLHEIKTKFYAVMIQIGAGNQIEQDIISSLAKTWNLSMLALFADVQSDDAKRQLEVAEQWAQLHPKDAVLMRVIGKLHSKADNFEHAYAYLSKSIALEPTTETYQLLGAIMLTQSQHDQAETIFEDGLKLTCAVTEKTKVAEVENLEITEVTEIATTAETVEKIIETAVTTNAKETEEVVAVIAKTPTKNKTQATIETIPLKKKNWLGIFKKIKK